MTRSRPGVQLGREELAIGLVPPGLGGDVEDIVFTSGEVV
jgi:hypothetical protein